MSIPNNSEWCEDILAEVQTYNEVLDGLEKEKAELLSKNMLIEAANIEKLIHAIAHKIKECQLRYEFVEEVIANEK